MNHNPHNLKKNDTVILSRGWDGYGDVVIVSIFKLFARVKQNKIIWTVLINRLTPNPQPQ